MVVWARLSGRPPSRLCSSSCAIDALFLWLAVHGHGLARYALPPCGSRLCAASPVKPAGEAPTRLSVPPPHRRPFLVSALLRPSCARVRGCFAALKRASVVAMALWPRSSPPTMVNVVASFKLFFFLGPPRCAPSACTRRGQERERLRGRLGSVLAASQAMRACAQHHGVSRAAQVPHSANCAALESFLRTLVVRSLDERLRGLPHVVLQSAGHRILSSARVRTAD